MKVFKDGLCYVDITDLTRYPLPSFISLEKECYTENEMAIFSDIDSIEYIKNREDILDYSLVCNLSEEELDSKVKETHDNLEKIASKWLESSIKEYSSTIWLLDLSINFML